MDLSKKKTVLDDSASIYQKREEKSDRAKWKELKGFKAKWEHFRAYYLLKTFIAVCVLAFVGYMVYEMFAPEKEKLIYVAVLDTALLTDELEDLQSGFETYMKMDKDEQTTVFDNTMNVSNTKDNSSLPMFTAHAYVGELDVLIAPESVIKQYAGVYVSDLSEQISDELYKEVSDCLFYADDNESGEKQKKQNAYGIYLSGLVEKNPYCKEPIVLAICGNTKRGENAEAFIRYLLRRAEEK